jgi:predicted house-cleaning NTP pyrophosphatase (Maf/HAM1 superfamily)
LKVSRLLLASESARRMDLLDTADYEYEAHKSGFPELVLEDPVKTVKWNYPEVADSLRLRHRNLLYCSLLIL